VVLLFQEPIQASSFLAFSYRISFLIKIPARDENARNIFFLLVAGYCTSASSYLQTTSNHNVKAHNQRRAYKCTTPLSAVAARRPLRTYTVKPTALYKVGWYSNKEGADGMLLSLHFRHWLLTSTLNFRILASASSLNNL
jgi:hypothetical protein